MTELCTEVFGAARRAPAAPVPRRRVAPAAVPVAAPAGPGRFNARSSATVGNGVEVKTSTIPKAGSGLFATRRFPKNSAITEYDGRRIDWEEAKRLRAAGQQSHVRTLTSQREAIDGLRRGIVGRGGGSLSNSGTGPRGPRYNNAKFKKVTDRASGRESVYLQAARDILPGEEIFVSYGRSYWDDDTDTDTD